jgi:hypothetical protein
MSRDRQHFRQSDLVKALKAMAKACVHGRVEITPDKMVVVVGETVAIVPEPDDPNVAIVPEPGDPNVNEWDTVK